MCKKCKKDSCSGCESESTAQAIANLENQVNELSETINEIKENAKFLLNGHPILLIEHPDDVDQFDIGSGLGSGDWETWAICDGQTHINSKKKSIYTPNFTDRFIVQAGGTYALDSVGGEAEHILVTNELPAHKHDINDPGHTHVVADPGHDHPISDPGHSHGGTGGSHTHTFTTSTNGDHSHLVPELVDQISNGGTGATAGNDPVTNGNSGTAGAHNHSGTTDPAAAGITINSSFTGVDVTNAFTGITIDDATTGITETENEGAGAPHNNLPPFYACFYVIKLG